jgi:hypothetical protein
MDKNKKRDGNAEQSDNAPIVTRENGNVCIGTDCFKITITPDKIKTEINQEGVRLGKCPDDVIAAYQREVIGGAFQGKDTWYKPYVPVVESETVPEKKNVKRSKTDS